MENKLLLLLLLLFIIIGISNITGPNIGFQCQTIGSSDNEWKNRKFPSAAFFLQYTDYRSDYPLSAFYP
jgi:hypothetical protein